MMNQKKRPKRIGALLLALMLSVSLAACGGGGTAGKETDDRDLSAYSGAEGYSVSSEVTDLVDIEMADGEHIVVKLYPDVAPITVANFQKLVAEGFYDGLIFHRVIYGFMIQGGDPEGTGAGGSAKTIKGEFSDNGVENNLLHKRGVISMARSKENNSASSQFFIVHITSPHLDGSYAAFGEVVSGLDVVDEIVKVKTDDRDKPVEDVVMKAVYFVTED